MCTVVTRWTPGGVAEVLAVRDELTSHEFDDPGRWWPDQPHLVGGRDRAAGGTWCAGDPRTGVVALVLNRPERPEGTPSRGILPLAAAGHGADWVERVGYRTMASFTLVLVGPDGVTTWEWDGADLRRRDLPAGLHVMTPRGVDPGDPRALRVTGEFARRPWLDVVTAERRSDAEDAMLVRHRHGDAVYATVFAQLIDPTPGRLVIRHSRTPEDVAAWVRDAWE